MPDVVAQLRDRFRAMSFGDARIIFVVGHPRSGIGKGHLVARLASLVDEPATVIKYEGMLNTNDGRNHPSPTDDVGTYARFCSGIVMGWPNQILAGEVIRDFINSYGGTDREHLMFVPHLSQHLALHLHTAWQACGSPSTLFVELGGTLTDPELAAFALPCVAQLRARHGRVAFMLLTEVSYDGPEPKARPIRQALSDAQAFGLQLDVVFLRLPAAVPPHRLETVAKEVETKIRESQVYGGRSPVIVPIPHFASDGLDGYRDHLKRYVHLLPHGHLTPRAAAGVRHG
jgi:CTP synthase (UTP-ammonia lyase)